jgi:hypothetical protein
VFSRVAQVPRYSNTFVESAFLLDKGLPVDIGLNYFDVYGLLMIPFVFPMIFSSLLVIFKRKNISLLYLLFFLLGILALLFSMGSNLPSFLNIFQYASEHLPLFSSNRTPARFSVQVALSLSLLGGIAVGLAYDRLSKFTCASLKAVKHSYKTLFAVSVIAIMFVSYIFSGVTLTYSVAGPYQSQPMPESASKVVAWLNQDDPNQDYRIIDLTQTHVIASYHRILLNGPDLVSKYWCSPSLAKMLGMLNAKYIITDDYSFINEKLLNLPNFYCVKIDQDLVFVNTLAQEEIYCSNGAIAIGGPNVLSTFYAAVDGTVSSMEISNAVSYYQNISSANWALFGPDVLAGQSSLNQFYNYNAIVFADSDLRDLVFQQLCSNYKFEAWKYLNANWSVVDDSSGVEAASAEFYQNAVDGQLVLSHRALYSDSKAALQIPINVNSTGLYDVWVRASNFLPSETTDVISTSIDGSLVGQADFGKVGGFKWLLVNNVSISLSKGSHVLNIVTSESPVYLDMVAVVPIGVVDSATTKEIASIENIPQMYVLEFSNYFVGTNVFKQDDILPFASHSSAGYLIPRPSSSGYLTLEPGSVVTQHLFIAKADSYALNLRFLDRPDGGILSVKIDGTLVNNIKTNGSLQWSWTSASYIYLTSGEHEIEVTSESGNNSIDIISLIEHPLVATLMGEPGNTHFSHIHLNTWQGTLNYTKPAFVVFAESCYPEWVFEVQTSHSNILVPSLEAFYFLNAYPVDSIGVSEFSVYHETSQIRNISFAATILTFIACMIVITIEVLRTRNFHKLSVKLRGNQSIVQLNKLEEL